MARYLIGTSGWHYDDWKSRFYPEKLPKEKWLEFYARHFSTLELNNTFYHLPTEKALNNWHDSSPPGFIFSVKVSRYITHIKRLKDCKEEMDKFMSRTVILKDKLGPLLYQLPPGLHRNDDTLAAFLSALPHGFKHVIEFRHASWFTDEVYSILRRYGVGFCVFNMPKLTSSLIATTDFAYVRFHGGDSLYSSCYSDKDLSDWAKRITKLGENLESVYVYFNNDIAGYAIKNAETIRGFLEG
jgi:uncharacterized protein YecE (DUF72 family)